MSAATFAAAQFVRALPRVPLTRMVGRLCEQRLPPSISRVLTNVYARAYRVDTGEAVPDDAPYRSFDEFFTRPLRPGVRVIEQAALVSPADGKLVEAGTVTSGELIWVKGKPYDVGELLGDAGEAEHYAGGSFAVIYLSPRDYHRVHAPAEGTIHFVRGVAGDLFPVNAVGEQIPRLLVRNHRVAIPIDSERLGRVTVVMVGAVIVGRISVTPLGAGRIGAGTHTLSPGVSVRQGEEIGIFHLGSTVVLLLGPGMTVTRGPGVIRYGQALVKGP